MTVQRIILLLFTTGWMIMIFCFSAQPGVESTEVSHRVGYVVGECFVPRFEQWPPQQQESFAAAVDYPVRKSAHALEYAILAVLLILTVNSFLCAGKEKGVKSLRIAFLTAVCYATSDEIHQYFVPGRSGRWQDVLIDSAGVCAGCLFFLLAQKIIRWIILRNQKIS